MTFKGLCSRNNRYPTNSPFCPPHPLASLMEILSVDLLQDDSKGVIPLLILLLDTAS